MEDMRIEDRKNAMDILSSFSIFDFQFSILDCNRLYAN